MTLTLRPDIMAMCENIWSWFSKTSLWNNIIRPHPVLSGTLLILAMMLGCAMATELKKRRDRILAADRRSVTARRTCDYYKNKLKAPDAKIETCDKKQFRRCEPLRDGMVPDQALQAMAWNWCYCQFVSSLIERDADMTIKASQAARHCVRREVKRQFQDALAEVPDKCRVWLSYIDPKGRTRGTYRFTYEPEEIIAAVSPDVSKTIAKLMSQGFRCAKCGRDMDDGIPYVMDPDTNKAICDECAVSKLASKKIREAMDPFRNE